MSFTKNMEKFDARVREITNRYHELKTKQNELKEEIDKGNEHFGALDTELLFSGDMTKVDTKYLELQRELDAITEYITRTERVGGVKILRRSDEVLAKIANEIVENIKKERKEDKVKKDKIEKQLEKQIDELEKTFVLKREIDAKRNSIESALGKINQHRREKANINLKDYEFNNGTTNYYLELALKHKEKNKR